MDHSSAKIIITLSFLLGAAFTHTATAQPHSAYEQGLVQLYRGQVDDALSTWQNSYEESERVDSRIGFEYIRVVTKRNLVDEFEAATKMYYSAILSGSGVNSRIAMRQEIERLKPITGGGLHRQWIEWWEQENSSLRSDMRGYWIQIDPSPARLVNERLIEHWQRISEARNRFTKNSSTIYGTDDRALMYIRYGEPSRVESGILTLQDLNIKPWFEGQIMPLEDFSRDEREKRQMNSGSDDDEMFSAAQVEAMEFAIYDFHRYPEYEIWFYDDITTRNEETVPFIFGTNIRNNQFGLLNGISQFIPDLAFNTDAFDERELAEFTRVGITPALILQLLYYEQLSAVDPFFENRLNNLRNRLLEQKREVYSGLDLNFKSESSDLIRKRSLQAPRQVSTIESKIPQIPVNVYQYRFLDKEMEPYLITFLESEPREAFMIDFSRNRPPDTSLEDLRDVENVTDHLKNYTLEHTLLHYDELWDVSRRETDEPDFHLHRNQFRPGAVSIFRSMHNERVRKSISAELVNEDAESINSAFDTPYPKSTRGLGSIHYREPEPLEVHPDSLQFADLVLGYQMQKRSVDEIFPFIVANSQTIPFRETLVLHFEVYNLAVQPNGFSRFELTYRILPVDESGNVLTDQAEFILTLNFTSEEERLIENLEIETADLNPGLYQLRVQITDVNSGQIKNRHTRFEVLE